MNASAASPGESLDALRQLARDTLAQLEASCEGSDLDAARQLLEKLRNKREHERLMEVAEALGRCDPNDAKTRRLYAQALIETGKVTAAIDVLQMLARRLKKGDPEALEVAGLLGRSYKQIFFDSRDRTSAPARAALKQAVAAYRKPYEDNPANTWHGVNLLALAANCSRLGIRLPAKLDRKSLAQKLLDTLRAPTYDGDPDWHLPTLAEVSLGTQDWSTITPIIRSYVGSPNVQAFQVASTLRQFTQIWNLEDDERGRELVNILRARLMQLPGGTIEMSANDLQRLNERPPKPDATRLEALLGELGPKTYRWWQKGLERGLSVAAVRQKLAGRVGTAFLVRARDFFAGESDELLAVTNFHVVNPNGLAPGIRPEEAEIVFEAANSNRICGVNKLLWSSPPDQCDASVLRLDVKVEDIKPLPIAESLPVLDSTARVYVIGHPGGRDLSFSFQDNELLDHEGPTSGKPQIPGVCRVHYRAPTEGGSSGSPVFNGNSWEVIALHHKGGKLGMPKLNGAAGSYAANEGIWIQSIVAQTKQLKP